MDKQAQVDLLPCPFCGTTPIMECVGIRHETEVLNAMMMHQIYCPGCFVKTEYDVVNCVVKIWNTRSTPLVALDREDAEKHANCIWEECATTGAIADYLQAKFGTPVARIPSEEMILKITDRYMGTTGNSSLCAARIRKLCEEVNKGVKY